MYTKLGTYLTEHLLPELIIQIDEFLIGQYRTCHKEKLQTSLKIISDRSLPFHPSLRPDREFDIIPCGNTCFVYSLCECGEPWTDTFIDNTPIHTSHKDCGRLSQYFDESEIIVERNSGISRLTILHNYKLRKTTDNK